MMRLATLLATAACALATPAAAQTFAVTNATVATGDGSEPIEGGYVVVENGAIAQVGRGTPSGNYSVIDAGGAWVTPGIFATVTNLGLWDVGAVSESNDSRAGNSPFSAALDVAPVVNPASQHILVHRAAGITRAATVTMPSASIFGGQGALIDLGADPQAISRPRAFQVVTLGERGGRIAGGSRAATHALLRNALREAGSYGDGARIPAGGAR
ncbi:MAG TPA: amidohydrolase, partial [Erythrobacter sp.]|nr:amidohydrolase [Erythrobacter sp.]